MAEFEKTSSLRLRIQCLLASAADLYDATKDTDQNTQAKQVYNSLYGSALLLGQLALAAQQSKEPPL